MPNFNKIANNKIATANALSGRSEEMSAKRYVGVKVIYATPMSRRDYLELRGWELPKDEHGDDEGYLVEYADQKATNVPGFTGYVSWSPKEVFDAAYTAV